MSTTITHKPVFFEKQEGIAPKAQEGDFQKIGNGAVKQVFKKIISDESGTLRLDPERVLYVSDAYLDWREIVGEVETAQDISQSLEKVSPGSKDRESHIQTDLVILQGQRAVSAPAAIGNLDDFIKREDIPLKTRLNIAFQVIKGMHNMQKAGYVTGDAKLENILVFEKDGHIIVRVSDFGKARKLESGSVSLVNGNPRFTGPENILTRESEVFSTGLMLLRVMEEGLNPDLCAQVAMPDRRAREVHDRRGIEGVLIQKGRKTRKGVTGQMAYTGSYALAKTTSPTAVSLKQAQREQNIIHRHIDTLSSNYFFAPHLEENSSFALLQVFQLIKDMTHASPEKRPSMAEAEQRFEKIMTTMEAPAIASRPPDTIVVQETLSKDAILEKSIMKKTPSSQPIFMDYFSAKDTVSDKIVESPSKETESAFLPETPSPSKDISSEKITFIEETPSQEKEIIFSDESRKETL